MPERNAVALVAAVRDAAAGLQAEWELLERSGAASGAAQLAERAWRSAQERHEELQRQVASSVDHLAGLSKQVRELEPLAFSQMIVDHGGAPDVVVDLEGVAGAHPDGAHHTRQRRVAERGNRLVPPNVDGTDPRCHTSASPIPVRPTAARVGPST